MLLPLHAQIARGVASQLKNLCTKVLADCCHVHSRGRTNAAVAGHTVLQVPVDTAHGELADVSRASVAPKRKGAQEGAPRPAIRHAKTGQLPTGEHGADLQTSARGARLRGALLLVGGCALASFTSLSALAALLPPHHHHQPASMPRPRRSTAGTSSHAA